jgi:C-terminal processing protease CtpA/Prc
LNVWKTILACLIVALALPLRSPASTLKADDFAQDFGDFWVTVNDGYALFDAKQVDWKRVYAEYIPRAAACQSRDDFIKVLEGAMSELYDAHCSLNVNLPTSPRLVPSGTDLWAEYIDGKVIVTQLRRGFSAETAGIRVGMEITKINGVPIDEAVTAHLPKCLRRSDPAARQWALLSTLAGTHNVRRRIIVAGRDQEFVLDVPGQRMTDDGWKDARVESRMLDSKIAIIIARDLGSSETCGEFDQALDSVKHAGGLILDLRETARGGDSSIAEHIMGRLVDRPGDYQQIVPPNGQVWNKAVVPVGPWTFRLPVVVLVDRWTASMGEGMAIGLDGLKRARVVGTPMAGLCGEVESRTLPRTGIPYQFVTANLRHIDGTPRQDWKPPVLVDIAELKSSVEPDPVLAAGVGELSKMMSALRAP